MKIKYWRTIENSREQMYKCCERYWAKSLSAGISDYHTVTVPFMIVLHSFRTFSSSTVRYYYMT